MSSFLGSILLIASPLIVLAGFLCAAKVWVETSSDPEVIGLGMIILGTLVANLGVNLRRRA